MAGPIKPSEALEKKAKDIPEEVFEAFNELIVANIDASGSATILQEDVIAKIKEKLRCTGKTFKFDWLDVEPAYRKAGWSVSYDKPGYNESYEASFNFSKKK